MICRPEELLKRLDEGKVYVPERAELAMMNFFREGNLNALREMALRLAADHVGQDVHDYLQAMQITGPWRSGHRLLVAVGPSPYSPHMIRWTRRLADNLDCPWLAVYVEQPQPLAGPDQDRLTQHLALARELGAEVITTADAGVAAACCASRASKTSPRSSWANRGIGPSLLRAWCGTAATLNCTSSALKPSKGRRGAPPLEIRAAIPAGAVSGRFGSRRPLHRVERRVG